MDPPTIFLHMEFSLSLGFHHTERTNAPLEERDAMQRERYHQPFELSSGALDFQGFEML